MSFDPNWLRLARKDFHDARRDRTLYYMGVLYVAFGVVLGRDYALSNPGTALSGGVAPVLLVLLLPVTALAASFDALPEQRRHGRLRLLLTLPHPRAGVVAGTMLGRTAVVATLSGTYLAVLAATATVYGVVPPLADLSMVAVGATLYAGAVSAVVVAAGVWTGSGPLALAAAAVALFGSLTWPSLLESAWIAVVGPSPPWMAAIRSATPLAGYLDAATLLHGGDPAAAAVVVAWPPLWLAVGVAAFDRTGI